MKKQELIEIAGTIYETAITEFWDTASNMCYDEVEDEKEGDFEIVYEEVARLLTKN